jgi:hypothetical protein
MKKLTSLTWLFALSLVLFSCAKDVGQIGPDAPPDAIPEIVGTYVLNGTDHLGNDYGGHLTISASEHPSEYQLQWIIIESVQEGSGILEGNQLKADWHSIDPSTEPYQGTVTYTITVNGELYGIRTVEGRDGQGKETAYPNQ